jgi:predicted nucleic acid-binding protein
MTIVVADTAPLHYLVQIGYADLLPQLFVNVWIPAAVVRELRQKRTPAIVRDWAEQLPSWIQVREIAGPPSEDELAGLDRGEWEAIELAKELKANLLLMDERFGVRLARQQGFTVTGTLGVLVEAARSGLISIDEALVRLAKTNFRRTPELFAQTQDLVRKSGKEGC